MASTLKEAVLPPDAFFLSKMQYIWSTPAKSNQKQTPTRAIFQESFCFSDNPFILLIKLRFTKVNKLNKYLRVDSKEKEGQGDKQQIS